MRRPITGMLSAILAAAMIITSPSIANASLATGTLKDRAKSGSTDVVEVIVELKDGAVLDYVTDVTSAKAEKIEKSIEKTQKSVQSTIVDQLDDDASVGFSYKKVVNAFSMEVEEWAIDEIAKLPEVKRVYKARTFSIPEPIVNSFAEATDTSSCCEMMGVDELHAAGYTGKGQVVCIIDNEFDFNHVAFDDTVASPKYSKSDIKTILANEEFNADVPVNQVWKNSKIPFAFNYTNKNGDTFATDEEVSHGTHVAGIAVGNGENTPFGESIGVAPDAQLIFMAVPNFGEAPLLAALEDAMNFDIDVINCSWGADYAMYDDILDEAFDNLEEAGVFVAAAAGNSSRGYYENSILPGDVSYSAIGSPAPIASTTAVASSDNTYVINVGPELTIDGNQIPFYDVTKGTKNESGVDKGFASNFSSTSYDFVMVEKDPASYALSLPEGITDLSGKIAVFTRGGAFFSAMGEFAEENNAAGMLVINNANTVAIGMQLEVDIPVATVSKTALEKFTSSVSGKLVAGTVDNPSKFPYTNGTMSDFSSWGVTSDLVLNPDITAPGGQIFSSVKNDEFESWNGTSMATPHVAGAVAVLSQYIDANYPEYAADDKKVEKEDFMEDLLMTSAEIIMRDGDPSTALPYSPRNQGAGELNLPSAINASAILLDKEEGGVSKISLKDGLTDEIEFSFYVKGIKGTDVTYNLDGLDLFTDNFGLKKDSYGNIYPVVTDSVALDTLEAVKFTDGDEENPQEITSVTVSKGETKKVTVSIKLDPEQTAENMEVFYNGFYVDGFVKLSNSDGNISIPFTGFYGDWTSQEVLGGDFYNDGNTDTFLGSGSKCGYIDGAYGDYDDSCFILGANIFDYINADPEEGLDEYYENACEAYAAISPNGDGFYDYLCFTTRPNREAGATTVVIRNSNGDEVLSESFDYMEKYYPNCVDFDNDDLAELPEGNYTATLYTSFNYEGAAPEVTNALNFKIDKTAPKITSAVVTTSGSTKTLTVNVSDNYNVMGVELESEEDEVFKPIYGGKTGSVSFDISEVTNLAELNLYVDDYAFNETKADVKTIVDATAKKNTPARATISSVVNDAKGITVTWGKNSAATGYYVYRSTDGGKKYSKIATITKNTTVSYTDTKATTNGAKYMYKVVAYKTLSGATFTGAASAVKTIYRLSTNSISSVKAASKAFTVSWSKNTKATGYQIQYSTSSKFTSGNKTVNVSGATSSSKTITGLAKAKKYYVRVRSYKKVGSVTYYSGWTTVKTVTTKK